MRDEELVPGKKLLALPEGAVAGELLPEGTLVAVCKGRVRFGSEPGEKGYNLLYVTFSSMYSILRTVFPRPTIP